MCVGASHGTELAVLWLLAQMVSSDLESSCLNELVCKSGRNKIPITERVENNDEGGEDIVNVLTRPT